MTIEEFKGTLAAASLPSTMPPALQALWLDAKGEWDKAHDMADSVEDKNGYWVHAYLHRKEGAPDNASYWYNLAGQPIASDSLDAEWTRIASALLSALR